MTVGRFMLLGGRLDHSSVELETGFDGAPAFVEYTSEPPKWQHDAQPETYRAVHVESGVHNWWCMVKVDHAPSRRDLLDTYPYIRT